jgi:type III secretory pathway component EscU
MRGLVSAINLLNTAVAYAIGLACSAVIKDPYLTWDFGGPSIAGFVLTIIFYWLFRHIDKEEYVLSENVVQTDAKEVEGSPVLGEEVDFEKKVVGAGVRPLDEGSEELGLERKV